MTKGRVKTTKMVEPSPSPSASVLQGFLDGIDGNNSRIQRLIDMTEIAISRNFGEDTPPSTAPGIDGDALIAQVDGLIAAQRALLTRLEETIARITDI